MRWPVALAWSADAKQLAYQVMGVTGGEIRLRDVGSGDDRLVSEVPAQGTADLRWSRDGGSLLYKDRGAYMSASVADGQRRPLFQGALARESMRLSPDQRSVWLIRDGEIWVQQIDAAAPRRVTDGEDYLARDSLRQKRQFCLPQWSPDSGSLAYIGRLSTGGAARNLGAKVVVVSTTGETLLEVIPEAGQFMFTIIDWSPDGRHLAITRTTEDSRRKELLVANLAAGSARTVWVDTDDRWVNYKTESTYKVAWSRDSARLSFISNRDGHRHLYLLDVASGESTQLTHGDFDVRWAGWSPEGGSIAFVSNERFAQRYLLWEIAVARGSTTQGPSKPGAKPSHARKLIADDHVWFDARSPLLRWSPDRQQIAFAFSGPNEPFGLGVLDRKSEQVARLRTGLAEGMTADDLAEMRAVRFPSADGTQVPAVMISSRRPAGTVRAAVIYTYGGDGQRATLGWWMLGKSILFNHLAQAGFDVLVVDPRGSSGYGDDYEKGLYHDAAGAQSEDLVAASRYLASDHGVDPKRVAIFGHSYGGFLAVQTMIQAPGVFGACISAAGQYDRRMDWQGSPVEARFGPPATSGPLLRERTPVFRAADVTAPLLLLHGGADILVPLLVAERFVTELMKAGKLFEFMMYPGDAHELGRAETQRDLMSRVERFLRTHLIGPSGSAVAESEASTSVQRER